MYLERLGMHVKNVAALPETSSPVISCYINNEASRFDSRCANQGNAQGIGPRRAIRLRTSTGKNGRVPRKRGQARIKGYCEIFPRWRIAILRRAAVRIVASERHFDGLSSAMENHNALPRLCQDVFTIGRKGPIQSLALLQKGFWRQ